MSLENISAEDDMLIWFPHALPKPSKFRIMRKIAHRDIIANLAANLRPFDHQANWPESFRFGTRASILFTCLGNVIGTFPTVMVAEAAARLVKGRVLPLQEWSAQQCAGTITGGVMQKKKRIPRLPAEAERYRLRQFFQMVIAAGLGEDPAPW